MSQNCQSEDLLTHDKKTFCYDIETLRSYFSAAFIDINSDERYLFEVYRVKNKNVNQIKNLIAFLRTKCKGLVGYNNLSFDYPILHYLLEKENFVSTLEIEELLELIYSLAQKQINAKGKGSRIKQPAIPQLDLLEMNYYNSKARFVSLKQLEFVMRYDNVQDMPYSHRFKIRKYTQAKEIADYNFNDVLATKMFYHKCNDAISLRKELSKQYGINLINHPETGLAKEAFAFELMKEMKLSRAELNKLGTKRGIIDVGKDVILPFIEFKTPEFKGLLEFYKKQKMTQLKGFFKKIDKKRAGYNDVIDYAFKEHVDKKTKTLSDLSVVFRDHVYVYGSGGIHSYFKGKTVVENDEWCIWDIDVKV